MRTTTLLLLFAVGASAATQLHYDSTLRRYSVQGDATGIELARMGLEAGGSILWTSDAHAARWNGQDEARFEFAAPAFRWTVRFRDAARRAPGVVERGKHRRNAAETRPLLPARRDRFPRAHPHACGHRRADPHRQWLSRARDPALRSRPVARRQNPHPVVFFDRARCPAARLRLFRPRRNLRLLRLGPGAPRSQAAAWSDFKGFALAPHASIDSEILRIDLNPDPFASLEHWADAVHDRYQPRIWPTIPSGWLGWSWVDPLTVERYEDVVLRNVHAIRRRLPGHDIELRLGQPRQPAGSPSRQLARLESRRVSFRPRGALEGTRVAELSPRPVGRRLLDGRSQPQLQRLARRVSPARRQSRRATATATSDR